MFIPRPLVPGKEHAVSTACKAGWALGLVWTCERSEKSLVPVEKSNKSRSTVTLSTEPPQLPHCPHSVQ
jgi:hypothetical protein